MKQPLRLLMVVLVLIPAAGVFYLLSTPRLTGYSPEGQDGRAAAAAPLRLSFSHTMDSASVQERLSLDPGIAGEFSWQGKDLIFTPQDGWSAGATVRVRLAPGARSAGFPNLTIREETTWTFTVRNPRIVYLFPSEGAANLYLYDPLSGENQVLTGSLSGVYEFDAEANGERLYYSASNGSSGSDIYRLDLSIPAEEREPELLLDCGPVSCRNPQISVHGDFLAYERSEATGSGNPTYARVWLLAIGGEQEPALVDEAGRQTMLPSWSHSGWLAYYDTTASTYSFLDPESGERRSFDNNSGQPGAWAPDGEFFIAPQGEPIQADTPDVSGRTAASSMSLVRYSLADGSTLTLSGASKYEDALPACSPDGEWVAYAHKDLDILHWTPGRQIWLMRPDGSEAKPLTNDPFFNHYDFSWNPDSRQLVYIRFNQESLLEPPEIWLVDIQTTQARRLVTGGFSPLWIP